MNFNEVCVRDVVLKDQNKKKKRNDLNLFRYFRSGKSFYWSLGREALSVTFFSKSSLITTEIKIIFPGCYVRFTYGYVTTKEKLRLKLYLL